MGNNACTITSGGTSFANLAINTSALPCQLADPLDVTGAFTMSVGTFDTTSNGYAVSIGGNVYVTSGTIKLNGSAVTVGGNWSSGNASVISFNAGTSTVTFNGGGVQTLSGSTTFYGLRALTTGSTLQFTAGSTQYATNMVDFENVSLKSTSSGSTWYFSYTGSSQTLIGLQVKDSNAAQGTTMVATGSSINLGNDTNWTFVNIVDSGVRYWVSGSGGNWSDSGNWSYSSGGAGGASVPMSTNPVVFDGAGGKNGNATVDATVAISSLVVSGYTGAINTGGFAVTISSDYVQTSGTVNATSSLVTVSGGFSSTGGTFTAGTSTVTFSGATVHALSGSTTFYALRSLAVGATVQFTAGTTQYVTGTLDLENASLKSSVNGAAWSIVDNSHEEHAQSVQVKDSDASDGYTILADTASVDLGNNLNWAFASSYALYQTRGSGNWYSTVPNQPWPSGLVPPSTATVVINPNHIVVATAPITLGAMTVSAGGRLDLDGTNQTVTLTVANGGSLTNNGTVRVYNDANAVTIAGQAGGSFSWTGTGVTLNGHKLYLGRLTYAPDMTILSGETLEMVGDTTFGKVTANSGSSFIHGTNNIVTLGADAVFAPGTFVRGGGTSIFRILNTVRLNSGGQNLGRVDTAP